jgi:hypothetical protein
LAGAVPYENCPHYPECCDAQAVSAPGQNETKKHVRSGGSFRQKRPWPTCCRHGWTCVEMRRPGVQLTAKIHPEGGQASIAPGERVATTFRTSQTAEWWSFMAVALDGRTDGRACYGRWTVASALSIASASFCGCRLNRWSFRPRTIRRRFAILSAMSVISRSCSGVTSAFSNASE